MFGSPARPWLPLGSAHMVDWNHLGHTPAPRGATAWVAALSSQDPVLVRTWTEETVTCFEFWVLNHQALTGKTTVQVSRPEPTRVHVRVELEVPSYVRYGDLTEFTEHSRTSLLGLRSRELDVREGDFDPSSTPLLTATQAEIFEFAPESALRTEGGDWLIKVLESLRSHYLGSAVDTAEGLPATPQPRRVITDSKLVTSSPAVEPEPYPSPPSRDLSEPAPAETPRAPAPTAPRLFATTNGGDSWEFTEEETYIGRSKQCGVVLKSQRVSRKHASVTREGDRWFVNDLGAANGIWMAANKIEREEIEDGAQYIIGDVLLTFSFS
ncbi:MAG: FHA domain-containing protein [Myxococcota bacterium]